MTPEEARAELIDLIASVEAIIPGQWERDKIPYGESCSLRGGAEGTHYYGDSLGPKASLDEKYAAQEKVKTLLESRAYRVEVTHDPGEGHVMRTVGFGPNKITIIYTTGDLQNVVGGKASAFLTRRENIAETASNYVSLGPTDKLTNSGKPVEHHE
ncbi:hypothetical protein [Arthrobacter sp. YN]|uniref:hypothetical protein n=1 Tax=Arthrobacter sp. YN TaxID=2020486 RepID=UPI0012FD9BA2|nr:hypothetical protein [Arthrobacter sp. YN]